MKTTARQYAQVLYDLTKDKSQESTDAVVLNFAETLKKDRKLKMFDEIIEKFEGIYNKENGIVKVKVTSVRELNNDQIKSLEEFVKSKYEAKEVEITQIVDEKIIGGLIVKIGDDVIDASVGGRIDKLKNDLLK